MRHSAPVDGFRLAHDSRGEGPVVVLLHGWPGDRRDWRSVVPLLGDELTVVVPDLRGFGESRGPADAPVPAFAADAQARSVVSLLDEIGAESAVLAGYDVGSRVAQQVARDAADRVRGLVIGPPVPGAGDRVLSAEAQPEFWYQHFHRLGLPESLIDGRPDAVRAYLRHFWTHWSGPGYTPAEADLDALVEVYGPPGAFLASINWYRAGAGTIARSLEESAPDPEDRLAVPTTVLWPAEDPLFPRAWGDRVGEFFAAAQILDIPNVGHFLPIEAPESLATAIRAVT